MHESESSEVHYISFHSSLTLFVLRIAVTYIFCQQDEEAADQSGHDEEASTAYVLLL